MIQHMHETRKNKNKKKKKIDLRGMWCWDEETRRRWNKKERNRRSKKGTMIPLSIYLSVYIYMWCSHFVSEWLKKKKTEDCSIIFQGETETNELTISKNLNNTRVRCIRTLLCCCYYIPTSIFILSSISFCLLFFLRKNICFFFFASFFPNLRHTWFRGKKITEIYDTLLHAHVSTG